MGFYERIVKYLANNDVVHLPLRMGGDKESINMIFNSWHDFVLVKRLLNKKKLTNKIPAKRIQSNLKLKKYTRAYLIVNEFNEILIRRRPAKGMLQSMIEIPNDLWVENKKNLILIEIKTFKQFKNFYNSLEINLLEISDKLKSIQKVKINNRKVKWIKKIKEINSLDQEKINRIHNELDSFAQQKIKEGFNYVIMGHYHHSYQKTLDSGKLILLGECNEKNYNYA